MNGTLVPTNTKKSLLILSVLRPIDAFILGIGIGISVICLILANNAPMWITIVSCLPMSIALILVLPIPNYHNTLVALQSVYRFYNERRNYIWRGWCVKDEFK